MSMGKIENIELFVIMRCFELNIFKFINLKYGKRWKKMKNLIQTNSWMKELD